MAKKTAPKKKAAPAKPAAKVAKKPVAKAAVAKSIKSVAKPVAKPAAKVAVKPAPVAKTSSKAPTKSTPKPAVMSKKPKAVVEEEIEEVRTPVKNQSVVSMIESDVAADESSKAEKVSKVKPVKIERGNTADEKAKWVELNKKYGKENAVAYKMSEKFQSMVPMQHKVLGWGFILTNENDRLEVLFETGIRMLISNYKS